MKKNTKLLFYAVISMGFVVVILSSLYADLPNKATTQYIIVDGKPVLIQDEMKLVGRYLYTLKINMGVNKLSDAVFDHCRMDGSDLEETIFVNCSFKGTYLRGSSMLDSYFPDSDFTDADICETKSLRINAEQLQSTRSFKNKALWNTNFWSCEFSNVDFSNFNLTGVEFDDVKLSGCNFTNAHIEKVKFGTPITKEQLASTASFQSKELIMVKFRQSDFSSMDFSSFNMTGAEFRYVNLASADFAGAIISRCDFYLAVNLTLDLIKSTWNYKVGRMEGIQLPKHIQDALDAEKKANNE